MEHHEMLRRMDREHRRSMVEVCLVALFIAASAVLSVVFLFHSFRALKGILTVIPFAIICLKYFPRPEKTLRNASTRSLIDIHSIADKTQRQRLSDELCDRARGRDRMAKAYLYGRDWESQVDGAGQKVIRNPWEGNALRLPKVDRMVVIDEQGRFRTVVSAATQRARIRVLWHFLWFILCCLALDLGRLLEPSNHSLARVLDSVGFIALSLGGIIPLFPSWRADKSLEGLPVNQVLFVFVHSRGQLRDEAGEWLRWRGSWDPLTRTIAARLGLMGEKAASEPKRVGADHV